MAAQISTDALVPGRRSATRPTVTGFADHAISTGPAPTDWFPAVDPDSVTDAGLSTARSLGADHAEIRITDIRSGYGMARDGEPTGSADHLEQGVGVRVLVAGCWGFAASDDRSPDAAADAARRAVALARVSGALAPDPEILAAEPAYVGHWSADHRVDPFAVPAEDRLALVVERTGSLLGPTVSHAEGHYSAERERTHYANSTGTAVQQQRVRVHGQWTAARVGDEGLHTMRTLAPPVARGWEFLAGLTDPVAGSPGWDWDEELAALPDLLAEKARAPGVEPGRYSLLIDPTNLWLTIHESVGHATEWDRVLGYETNYAGTTFVRERDPGRLRYGSPAMTILADRLAPHGLSSTAWDHEGVAAQQWPIITDGVLATPQLDRAMATRFGLQRSNGCAFADSALHPPLQRMPNINLAPDPHGADSLRELAAAMGEGFLVLGDDSWSIDMQRRNFQFTGQRFLRVTGGEIRGQVRDLAYQATTIDFWRSLTAVGGPTTYMLGGADNCGKGQPAQSAPVSHGAPAAVFAGVNVLNTMREAGR